MSLNLSLPFSLVDALHDIDVISIYVFGNTIKHNVLFTVRLKPFLKPMVLLDVTPGHHPEREIDILLMFQNRKATQ